MPEVVPGLGQYRTETVVVAAASTAPHPWRLHERVSCREALRLLLASGEGNVHPIPVRNNAARLVDSAEEGAVFGDVLGRA